MNESKFARWWKNVETPDKHNLSALAAWNHQQDIIDSVKNDNTKLEARVKELEDKEWQHRRERKEQQEKLNEVFSEIKQEFAKYFVFDANTHQDFKTVIFKILDKWKQRESELLAIGIVVNNLPKEEFSIKHEGSYMFVESWDKFRNLLQKANQPEVAKALLKHLEALRELKNNLNHLIDRKYRYSTHDEGKDFKALLDNKDLECEIIQQWNCNKIEFK